MTEEPEFTTEYHLIDEFLPPEPVQDAYWWWERFKGFDEEVYMILENDKINEDEKALLSMLLKQRQRKLLKKWENGGRDDPHDEELRMEDFNYLTLDLLTKCHPKLQATN